MAAVASSLALYRGQRAPAGSPPSSSRARAIRRPWSFVLQDGQQPAPVTGSIAFHQARDTVTEKGGPGDEGSRQRPGHRLIRRRRLGPGNPVPAGLVAVAPLRRDQLVHPSLMAQATRWDAPGLPTPLPARTHRHGGRSRPSGLMAHPGRSPSRTAPGSRGPGPLSHDRHRCCRGPWVVQVAGVPMEIRHAGDGARQHFLQWLVGLGRC